MPEEKAQRDILSEVSEGTSQDVSLTPKIFRLTSFVHSWYSLPGKNHAYSPAPVDPETRNSRILILLWTAFSKPLVFTLLWTIGGGGGHVSASCQIRLVFRRFANQLY